MNKLLTALVSVASDWDNLYLGGKVYSNLEIAGFLRNLFSRVFLIEFLMGKVLNLCGGNESLSNRFNLRII